MEIANNRQRIARWLRSLGEQQGDASPHFVLRHLNINDRLAEIASWGPVKLPIEDDAIGDLVKKMGDALETDAEVFRGVQKYFIAAMVEGHAVGRLSLVCADASADSAPGEPLESEPATTKGVLALLMRHLEAQTRMYTLSMGQVVSQMQRSLARLQAGAELGEERRLESVAIAERLLSREHKRELATKQAEFQQDIKRETFQKLLAVLPLVAAAVTGKGAASHLMQLFERLIGSLRPEQYDVLARHFTPDQMEIINSLIKLHDAVKRPAEPTDPSAAASATAQAAAEGGG